MTINLQLVNFMVQNRTVADDNQFTTDTVDFMVKIELWLMTFDLQLVLLTSWYKIELWLVTV